MHNILVTGGAGFIGSNFVQYILNTYDTYQVTVFDKLTYAGNMDNLIPVSDSPRYHFVRGDICDKAAVDAAIRDYTIDTIVNFAAETHVDRSIMDPDAFIQTSVYGTYVLLEAARAHGLERFIKYRLTRFTATSRPGNRAKRPIKLIHAAPMPPARPAPISW